MAKIYLARHGETDWNRERRVMGRSNSPLNTIGVAQAKQLAKRLAGAGITAIYSSPLPRALETAEMLGASLGLIPMAEPRLLEVDMGSWEGRYWSELDGDPIRQRYYEEPKTARPPGGETLWEAQQRAVAVTDELHRHQPDGAFLLVSHADVIRCVLAHYLKIDLQTARQFRIDHASVSLISPDSKVAILDFLNLTNTHFQPDE
jgi:broad specificity phosphatase PhoE